MPERSFLSGRHALLGLVFALSGLLAWWQLRGLPEETEPAAPRPRVPDYVVLRFAAVETDPAGQPARRLLADELRQYVDEKLSELERPRLTLFQEAAPPWEASARQGRAFEDGERIELLGEVRLERAAGKGVRPFRLETERLDVWPGQSLAETDLQVRIASQDDRLTATGMKFWYAEPSRATFGGGGRTRIQLAPQEQP